MYLKLIISIFGITVALSGAQALTKNESDYKQLIKIVQQLDVKQSCQSKRNKQTAIQSLKWFLAFKQNDIAEQMNLFSNNFEMHHSSLKIVAERIEKAKKAGIALPPYLMNLGFTSEPIAKNQYVYAMTLIAFGNDINRHSDIPVTIECKTNHEVEVMVAFKGYKVNRDANGYIIYEQEYLGPVKKTFLFDPASHLIQKHIVEFDQVLADAADANLKARRAAGESPLLADEQTRSKYEEVLAGYLTQLTL